MKKLITLLFFALVFEGFAQEARLKTPWTDQVSRENPHPEYPRPQLVRSQWQSLNGTWKYAIEDRGESLPADFDGDILVPFPVESYLSGVQKTVGSEKVLWYEKVFQWDGNKKNERVLLHFGGVDWEAEVWVNGQKAGIHRGGFDDFSFDITGLLVEGPEQKINVRVWDPSDDGPQPRGKQVKEPRGIWYTPVTGIWQTVWLEKVPMQYIQKVNPNTLWEEKSLVFDVEAQNSSSNLMVKITLSDGEEPIASVTSNLGERIQIPISNPKAWSPDEPFLYDVTVQLMDGKKVLDEVTSYTAYRDIRMAEDQDGFQRLMLNGEALFQFGPLDQGWWPDGLYTAPNDAALIFDIEKTKEMGFNMIRKHAKVEPARWYYHADRLGILVWQDMPSGDLGNRWEVRPGIIRENVVKERTEESKAIFREEWKEIMDQFKFFPSIVVWVPFNEAWGQFDTREIVEMTREIDPTRLINSASGGNFVMDGFSVVGDILDLHNYPDPVMPDPALFGKGKAMVLGEYGGLGLPLEGHTWQDTDNWGYQRFTTETELKERYAALLKTVLKYKGMGLSAAIYTQTTDVEIETNGLITYDRKVVKMPMDFLRNLHLLLYREE
ncbi:glycoside hydrolase family 2 protein [Algoriphagus namhaensis]|uniref:Glycoside hydrolase family 2 protein n=1 Tax=Algoriphagus namhaensis TaxID=915353 RepID=A0ABV8AX16_9BACT